MPDFSQIAAQLELRCSQDVPKFTQTLSQLSVVTDIAGKEGAKASWLVPVNGGC